jgi:hypothetical protein
MEGEGLSATDIGELSDMAWIRNEANDIGLA